MYRNIKSVAKNLGFRGWSLLRDTDDKMYLSKFDPAEKRNNDEYRIYFFIDNNEIKIVRRFVMWASKYKENIDIYNPFYKEAELILKTYYNLYNHNHSHSHKKVG